MDVGRLAQRPAEIVLGEGVHVCKRIHLVIWRDKVTVREIIECSGIKS
jgi:hypothetical protein